MIGILNSFLYIIYSRIIPQIYGAIKRYFSGSLIFQGRTATQLAFSYIGLWVIFIPALFIGACSEDRPRPISFAKEIRPNKSEGQLFKSGDPLIIEMEDSSLPLERRSRRSASMNFVREAAALIESDKDREVAIQILEKAITVDPTNPYAFFMLGRAFSKERQHESAAAAYSLAIIHFKNRANWLLESYLQLGLVYEKTSPKPQSFWLHRH